MPWDGDEMGKETQGAEPVVLGDSVRDCRRRKTDKYLNLEVNFGGEKNYFIIVETLLLTQERNHPNCGHLFS